MSKYSREDIIRMVEDEDVEFIRLQFTDIFGILKNVAITASQLNKALNNDCMFDGSAIEGFVRIDESDMYLHPDLDTFEIFPWRPQQGKVARLICDVYNPDGTDVKDGLTMDPSFKDMDRVFKAIDEQYHMKAIGRTVRYVHSGSNNSLKAFFYTNGETYESKTINFEIVDRVGGGDAFSSGLIYALMQNDMTPQETVDFAVASSVMKHAIRGDTNITSVDQIKRLMNNASFDVQR